MIRTPIQSFFEAESYAIIGATANREKLGWHIVNNFINSYRGRFYFINPKGGEIEGYPVYKSVLDVEEPIEAAVIAIPARFVIPVVEQCIQKGIQSIIVESGGFSEIGESGKVLQTRLVDLIKNAPIETRLIGPNCIGVVSPSTGIDTIFIPLDRVGRPSQGPISFFTQSGALGSAILSNFTHEADGKWISRFASYGNAADVDESDLLEYFGADRETEIILGHLEGFRNGSRFLELAEQISEYKPIVILKTNRTELGATASASHSASVAANDEVVSALLKQVGVIRVDEFEELIRVARAIKNQPIPNGPKIGIVTDGGGFAVSASDAVEREELILGNLNNDTIQTFKAKYPPWYISGNPLDLTGTVTAEEFMFGIEQFLFDSNVDVVLMIIIPSAPQFVVQDFLDQFTEFLTHVKPHHPESARKPIFSVTLGGEESKIIDAKMDKLDIPVYPTPDKALKIIRYLVDYREYLNSLE